MKKTFTVIASILMFTVGICVMFYPTFSNWLHERSASHVITDYLEKTSVKSYDEFDKEFAVARAYNATLPEDVRAFLQIQMEEGKGSSNPDYLNALNEVDGIMGIIEIPKMKISLPIYHGTEESALQKGAGHLEGSALPTGDVGNHTVITGHTGLPSAQLFTGLDELIIGDRFYLEILDQVFTYEVCEINVVLPSETDKLVAVPDKDLVTLVTCTPYGVNSHRLLVRGERIEEDPPAELAQTAHAERLANQPEPVSHALDNLPMLVGIAIGCGVLFLMAIVFVVVQGIHKPARLAVADTKKQSVGSSEQE